MGHVFAEIDLSNPRKSDLDSVRVKALVDTGALMLCIPEHITLQLKLETESTREASVADGRSMNVPYVGPVRKGLVNHRYRVLRLWRSGWNFCEQDRRSVRRESCRP